jgi:hypothetical protein
MLLFFEEECIAIGPVRVLTDLCGYSRYKKKRILLLFLKEECIAIGPVRVLTDLCGYSRSRKQKQEQP